MQLIQVIFRGFRRLKDTKINLDGKIIAIVGPNEAGKTSLLQAISSLQNNIPLTSSQLTRGSQLRNENDIVQARFLLDTEERVWTKELGAIGEPKWYVLNKNFDGGRTHSLEPRVSRDISRREKVSARLEQLLGMNSIQRYLTRLTSEDKDIPETVEELLREIKEELDRDVEDLSEVVCKRMDELVSVFVDLEKEAHSKRVARTIEITRNSLEELIPLEKEKNPYSILLERISDHQPDILYFSEEDRNLASDYSIDVLAAPPKALKNLFDLANVDFSKLHNALTQQDFGLREKIVEQANERLKNVFEEAWRQHSIFVRFQIDSDTIRILLPAVGAYSDIAERSDGLRSFIALYAFIYLKAKSEKPILLIDEAEAHLHYDAQADLIKVFESQTSASQIIYSTHSAGCLPNDYGSAARVVSPLYDEKGKDLGISEVNNSFWNAGPGFSPLFFAMGASVLASARSRRMVLTKGGSDLILLPYLFREVAQVSSLDFQIAPGLANATRIEMQELNLEAPKVVYFLDGDQAGKKLARRLKSLGIPDEQINTLDEPYTIEDFVDLNVYLQAVNEELRRSYGSNYQFSAGDISSQKILDSLESWCKQNNISIPKKVKVAYHIVSASRDKNIVRSEHREPLLNLYNEIIAFFNQ